MTKANYGDAAAQVLDILYHTNKQDVMKIPENFIKFLTNNAFRKVNE